MELKNNIPLKYDILSPVDGHLIQRCHKVTTAMEVLLNLRYPKWAIVEVKGRQPVVYRLYWTLTVSGQMIPTTISGYGDTSDLARQALAHRLILQCAGKPGWAHVEMRVA